MITGVPAEERSAAGSPVLRAEVGGALVLDGGGMAGIPRIGTIITVTGQDGSPPYLVHWLAGEHESRIWPGPNARVQKHQPMSRRD